MVPILIVVGLMIGLLPRWWRVAGVLAVGILSVVLFAQDDLLQGTVDMVGVFGLAVANTGVGAFFGWLVRRVATRQSGT